MKGINGIWQIYIEGFVQFYQSKLMDKDIYTRSIEWTNKCNLEYIAAIDLKTIENELLEFLTY